MYDESLLQEIGGGLRGLRARAAAPKSDLTVIMMHGFGANAFDLFPFAQFFDSLGFKEWIFPQAPIEISGMPLGRAWYPIDIEALERSMISGKFRDFSEPMPAEASQSAKSIVSLVDDLKLNPEKVILGGFSQGAILSTKITIENRLPLAGLAILSGIMMEPSKWSHLIDEYDHKKLVYFQSHGLRDPLLPIDGARQLNQCFLANEWQGEYVEFDGEHEIPKLALSQWASVLSDLSHSHKV